MKKILFYFLLSISSNALLAQSLSELKKRYYSVDEILTNGFRRVFTKDYKIGYVDATGKEIISPQYSSGTPFRMGLASVAIKNPNENNYKYGIINEKNVPILPFEFEMTGNFEYGNNCIVIQRGGKSGIFSLKDKKIILPVDYQSIMPITVVLNNLNKEYFIINKNNLFGVIDEELKQVMPSQYVKFSPFYKSLFVAQQQGKGVGVVDINGKIIIPFKYQNLEYTGDVKGTMSLYSVVLDGKFGIIDEKDNILIPCNFESIKLNNIKNEEWLFFAKKNGKTGILNSKGGWIVQPQYDDIVSGSYYSEDKFTASKNGKWGVISINNEVLVDFKYDIKIDGFGYYEFTQVTKDGKVGLIDKAGKEVIIPQYDWMQGQFGTDGLMIVMINRKYGMIDRQDNVVIPFEYESISSVQEDNIYIISKKKGYSSVYGCVNAKGEVVIPIIYKEIDSFQNGVAKVRDYLGKMGYINTKGELIMEPLYDNITISVNGARIVENKNKFGLISKDGKTLIPVQYKGMIFFSNGYEGKITKVQYKDDKDKWGVLSSSGEILVEAIYDSPIENAYGTTNLIAKLNDMKGVLNKDYKVIIDFKYDNFIPAYNNTFITSLNGLSGLINKEYKEILKPEY
jgi:hypothetical protein